MNEESTTSSHTIPQPLRWLHLDHAKSSLIITAIFLVVMLVVTVYMQRKMQDLTYLQDGDANFALRPIAQLQRETLLYMVLIEADAPAADLLLQADIVESRVNILERHYADELIATNIFEKFFDLGAQWRATDALRMQFVLGSATDMTRDELIDQLEQLERATNNLLREYNTWYGVAATQLSRRYSRMFLTSQMVAAIFVVIAGVVTSSLFQSSAEIQSNEARLLESEERYLLATQAGKLGIWEYEPEERCVTFDLQSIKMIGTDTANIPFSALVKRIRPEGRAKLREQVQRIAAGQTQRLEAEIEFETVADGIRWYLVRGRRKPSQPKLLIGTVTDVSERKATEAAAMEAQRLESLGILVGGIAHDFNNLLTGIVSQQSVALRKLKEENPAIKSHIIKAQNSAERAATLTRQLLDYAGKPQRMAEVVDLNELLNDNRELFDTFIDRRAELRFNQSSHSLLVDGNSGQLQQIVMNLVINAAEAISGSEGCVTISTSLLSNGKEHHLQQGRFITDEPQAIPYIRLTVEDTGVGMSAETLRRIFDPFFTTKTHGRGLGLSATLGIIKSHNGALHLHSELGSGTRITVLLPLSSEPVVADEQVLNEWDIQSKVKNVLVIDDESLVRQSITDLLDLMGIQALTAENGREGIACYQQNRDNISLVIVDMQMPIMDGAETILRLKQIDPAVKIILSSGYSETSSLDRLVDERPNAFLQKPYVIDTFFETIDNVLAA